LCRDERHARSLGGPGAVMHRAYPAGRPPAQILACANALGSCLESDAQPRVGEGMHDAGGRQPPGCQAIHPLPANPGALAAAL